MSVSPRRYIPPPVHDPMFTEGGNLSHAWVAFFQQVGQPKVHQNVFAKKPTNLSSADYGLLFRATDYNRVWVWNGSAWERADGELPTLIVGLFCVAPGTGWKLLDGTGNPFTYTKDDATTATISIQDARGYFPKFGSSFTGNQVAAVAPGISGNTANESTHTHPINHDHGSFDSGSPSSTIEVQSGTGTTVATSSHLHSVDPPNFTGASGAGDAHLHAVGTLAVDNTGEPKNMVFLPYVRL